MIKIQKSNIDACLKQCLSATKRGDDKHAADLWRRWESLSDAYVAQEGLTSEDYYLDYYLAPVGEKA